MSLSVLTIFAQRTPCDSPHPTPQVLATVQQNIASVPVPSAPFTWEIPVRVTVFLKDDGSGLSAAVSEAQIDDFLSNMNGELVGGPNTYHFYRCGPINFIHNIGIKAGNFPVTDYSYAANFLNLYLYTDPNTNPQAEFPWNYPIGNALYLTGGVDNLSSGTGIHELGHTLGLLHTFSPQAPYIVPATPAQSDWPYHTTGARELMLTGFNIPGKEFKDENKEYAGDRVADTPPGCDDDPDFAVYYPSASSIAGC
ncbi:MAG: hypothetical protein IPN76_31845 [Saprospiraceae bacterium]|nr:hypothetical protein [Saprospiraceae bacterium]